MRNFSTFLAGILIVSPVAGLRPDAGLAVHEHELAESGKGEALLRFLVGELRSSDFEHELAVLRGTSASSAM